MLVQGKDSLTAYLDGRMLDASSSKDATMYMSLAMGSQDWPRFKAQDKCVPVYNGRTCNDRASAQSIAIKYLDGVFMISLFNTGADSVANISPRWEDKKVVEIMHVRESFLPAIFPPVPKLILRHVVKLHDCAMPGTRGLALPLHLFLPSYTRTMIGCHR